MKRLAFITSLSLATAFLASGCLWGVVTDSETGAPLVGAKVRVSDSEGDGFEATTDSHGIYVFDPELGPVPSTGPAAFAIWLWGCDLAKNWVVRDIQYDDNPTAEKARDFWEIQHLSTCHYYLNATPTPTPTMVYVPRQLPTSTPVPPPR